MDATQLSSTLPRFTPALPVTPLRLVPGDRPTLDFVFDTPLAELTAELHVEVITSEITDPDFFGCTVVRGSRIVVMLSPNLGDFEVDFFTRYLTAQAYRLEMSPLPTPFDVEVSPMLEGVSA